MVSCPVILRFSTQPRNQYIPVAFVVNQCQYGLLPENFYIEKTKLLPYSLPPCTSASHIFQINPLTAHMAEMGFPIHWCERALAETGDDIEAALNWILSNGELLSVEDSLRESIQAESQASVDVAAAEMARAEAAAPVVAAEAEVATAVAEAGNADGEAMAGGEGVIREGMGEEQQRESGDRGVEQRGWESGQSGWIGDHAQGQQVGLISGRREVEVLLCFLFGWHSVFIGLRVVLVFSLYAVQVKCFLFGWFCVFDTYVCVEKVFLHAVQSGHNSSVPGCLEGC